MISRVYPDLRAQLAAVINTPQHSSAPNAHSAHHNSHPTHGYGADSVPGAASNSNSLHHHTGHNIDPAIAGQASSDMMSGSAGDSGGDDSLGDGRKGGKRELSQSKRAAQNRAAQVCGFSHFSIDGKRHCFPEVASRQLVNCYLVDLSILMSSPAYLSLSQRKTITMSNQTVEPYMSQYKELTCVAI